MSGLAVSDVVNVQVTLSPKASPTRNFGAALKVGATDGVVDPSERIRTYSDMTQVTEDWAVGTPEYGAALAHFSQQPVPAILYIGRFVQAASRAVLHGAALTPLQQLMANFQAITNGALEVSINGVPVAAQGVSFAAAVNLNGVAYALQQALNGQATVAWNPSYGRFDVYTVATGPTATLGYAKPPTAVGSINYAANPTPGETETFNGTPFTYVAAAPTATQVLVGASLAATLQNLVSTLNSSTDVQARKFTFALPGTSLELTAASPGPGGNALTYSSTAGVTAGATLAGGQGTDISAIMGLSQAAGALVPVFGSPPESAAACVAALADKSSAWYDVDFALSTPLAAADVEAVGELVEALAPSRIFGYTVVTTDVLAPNVSSDIASILQSLTLSRTFTQYSSSSPYAVASLFARISTVDFTAQNTTITEKFKVQPGIAAEVLTETQAASLTAKNCNVFVDYEDGSAIVQQGVMSNGDFIDERVGLDWFQNQLQVDLFNVLKSFGKVPQTDAGNHILTTQANVTCGKAVYNGLVAPGQWNGPSFGSLKTGDALPAGYYVFCDLVANQSQADREARKGMPIQIALKFAGAIHSVDVLVTVNR